MVDTDEISGYIKLFDFGCGMEYGLIVNGEEQGALIFFDCDGRFEKIEHKTLFDIYEAWIDNSLETLKRVQNKLEEMPLQDVIDSEWELKNFFCQRNDIKHHGCRTPSRKLFRECLKNSPGKRISEMEK